MKYFMLHEPWQIIVPVGWRLVIHLFLLKSLTVFSFEPSFDRIKENHISSNFGKVTWEYISCYMRQDEVKYFHITRLSCLLLYTTSEVENWITWKSVRKALVFDVLFTECSVTNFCPFVASKLAFLIKFWVKSEFCWVVNTYDRRTI